MRTPFETKQPRKLETKSSSHDISWKIRRYPRGKTNETIAPGTRVLDRCIDSFEIMYSPLPKTRRRGGLYTSRNDQVRRLFAATWCFADISRADRARVTLARSWRQRIKESRRMTVGRTKIVKPAGLFRKSNPPSFGYFANEILRGEERRCNVATTALRTELGFVRRCDNIGLATKWLRILSLGGIAKIRNHLVANPIHSSNTYKLKKNYTKQKWYKNDKEYWNVSFL